MTDKPKPISFRPTVQDIEHIAEIRRGLEWIASDADAIRYALDLAARLVRAELARVLDDEVLHEMRMEQPPHLSHR